MADIRTAWSADRLAGDWLMDGPQLAADRDLETAVILSLFTDRRALPDDALPGSALRGGGGDQDPRGWWGDAADAGSTTVPLGSRLWLLEREKQTEETRLRAEGYAREALRWLIDDGVAEATQVAAQWLATGHLSVAVTVIRGAGARFERRFDWAWKELT